MKNLTICGPVLAALALLTTQSALAQEVTFKIAHFLPAVAATQKAVLQPWCDEMGSCRMAGSSASSTPPCNSAVRRPNWPIR